MDNLDPIFEDIRLILETKNTLRDSLINLSRVLIRHCGNAIRAMHRQEWENVGSLLNAAHEVQNQMRQGIESHPDLYYAGYMQDAFKEYVEACATFALLRDQEMPTPRTLGVESATYLNGLAEAASELRRYVLDLLRHDHYQRSEELLGKMDMVYDMLITFDFPDAISGGLRHRVDNLRGVLEKTRGDVTVSLRQQRLQAALEKADSSRPHTPSNRSVEAPNED